LSFLLLLHPVVDVVVGAVFGSLGGTGSNGAFEITVVDATGENLHEGGQFVRRAKDAPRVIGTCVGGDGCTGASGLSEFVQIFPAAGTNVEGARFYADDGQPRCEVLSETDSGTLPEG
jgi:hypothetical protein